MIWFYHDTISHWLSYYKIQIIALGRSNDGYLWYTCMCGLVVITSGRMSKINSYVDSLYKAINLAVYISVA